MKTDRFQEEVAIPVPSDAIKLDGNLVIPHNAKGIVIFVHGSGSSRFSPRNNLVADFLNRESFGTLLFDLLTRQEESIDAITTSLRFDIDLLSRRLTGVTNWLDEKNETRDLPKGYFGASTGAAAALISSINRKDVSAIVSRGGRPDLAGQKLSRVGAPSLFIVGGDDRPVIEMNKQALDALGSRIKKIEIVPGATHLFEEPGALEQVARLAAGWFARYFE